MNPPIKIIHHARDLTPYLGGVFVPTMGALHAGHAALIRYAAERASQRRSNTRDASASDLGRPLPVIVSVFVNPTQFNEKSDFDRYPRTLDADARVCELAGGDVIFAPSVDDVYPHGANVGVPALPAVATEPELEDLFRPGHFAGVCQVCKRLFELVRPTIAVFGEKDWQQLQVVSTMVAALGMPLEVIGHPTIREPDGLAMSSRNVHLSPVDRVRALAICRAMVAAGEQTDPVVAETVARRVLSEAGIEPEYAAIREASSLGSLHRESGRYPPARILMAARVGTTRLIDNAPWPGFNPRA